MARPVCTTWLNDNPADVCGRYAPVLVETKCRNGHRAIEASCILHLGEMSEKKIECVTCYLADYTSDVSLKIKRILDLNDEREQAALDG